jgi:hypothetical protein
MSPRDGVWCPSPAAGARCGATAQADVRNGSVTHKVASPRFAFGALAGGAAAYVWIATISGMIRMATMFAILIIGLIAGPAVSL